ncbi:MAG: carbamate kinase [Planctomycetota bacterium]
MGADRIAVVAFGGNALILKGEPGHEQDQIRHAEALADSLLKFLERGYRLLLVHGNGPQVGNALIRVEESSPKVPGLALDSCVAQTEGSIGYFLELAIRNACERENFPAEVASVLTTVLVDADDPRIKSPSKPVGPFYTRYRADYLVRMFDWDLVDDAGRGYRRVVASPKPVRVMNDTLVKTLLTQAHVVVAGGGGGIPVTRKDGKLIGVEAVIDKDYTAALLAKAVDADLFMILTAVDHVSLDFGKPAEKRIGTATVSEAERWLGEGQFPPGSMGPKIDASIDFAREQGGTVLITSVDALPDALEERAGTRIVPDGDSEITE